MYIFVIMNKYLIIFFFSFSSIFAQFDGVIKGKIVNTVNNEPIPFANLIVENTTIGAVTDIEGNFTITGVEPGFRNVIVTCVGFKSFTYRDVAVTNSDPAIIEIKLEESTKDLGEVEIKASPYNKTTESPVSLRTIGIAEIERNPGGNRDISNVIKSFPGVISVPSFRNDILIRGGSPSENRFYLDEVEVPVINHFQTQGASGGPTGIINVNLIREVDFLSGAFPSNRGNALSSVLDFKQVDGNNERWKFRLAVGSSDAAVKADGPIGKKTSLIVSARVSYLQFLFSALRLPFLPTYYDLQFKYKIKFDKKNELYFIGLGAIDLFRLNKSQGLSEQSIYLLNNLPVFNQWNYTLGGVYKHFAKKSTHTFVLSRSMFSNEIYKNKDNNEDSVRTFSFNSREIENKFRYEYKFADNGWKINAGVNLEYAKYTIDNFFLINYFGTIDTINFKNELNLFNGGLFGSISKSLFKEKLNLSLGFRFDNSSYNSEMALPWNQFSPRFSLTYNFVPMFAFNASIGRYHQRPQYSLLGYSDANGNLINKQNGIRYIQCDHIIAGFEANPTPNTKITIEGFFKYYRDYPMSLNDSVSLANVGANFGVVGNVPATSRGDGRAYGVEVLVQQKLWKGFYGILAYTYVRSEFQDKNFIFTPSSWDAQHLVSITAGYKFKRNWEVGARWRLTGGLPFTPFDVELSRTTFIWDINRQGIPDNNRLNTQRLEPFTQLDIRVDKIWYFKKWSLNIYVDIQNVYLAKSIGQPLIDVVKDSNGNPVLDPLDPTKYQVKFLPNEFGTLLPSLGIIADF